MEENTKDLQGEIFICLYRQGGMVFNASFSRLKKFPYQMGWVTILSTSRVHALEASDYCRCVQLHESSL